MKIKDIGVHLLSHVLPEDERFEWSMGTTVKRDMVLVEIETDEGISGLGEVGEVGFSPPASREIVEHGFKPWLLGRNPMQIERLARMMFIRSATIGKRGLVISVLSAIEQALFDIVGKALNVPVYQLLGGQCHDSIRVYGSSGHRATLDKMGRQAEQLVDQGFSALKVRIGYSLEEDVEIVTRMRKTFGPHFDLAVDCNQAYVDTPWNFTEAFRRLSLLEEFRLMWIEEPLPLWDIEGYVELARQLNTPIAAGETESSFSGYLPFILRRGVDVVQVDVTHTGGFLECKRVAHMASEYSMFCVPHVFKGGVSFAANWHLIASLPNCPIMEYDTRHNPLVEAVLVDKPVFEMGHINCPALPGLGVELRPAVLEKYPYVPGPTTVRR